MNTSPDGNAVVDATAELADDVSDASTIVAAGGIVAAPFTGGSSLTVTAYALGVGTAADTTSLAAKTVDAVAFDGSGEAAFSQLGELTVNALGARYLPRAGAATVRYLETATQATRRVPASMGIRITVNAATDATRVAIPVILFNQ